MTDPRIIPPRPNCPPTIGMPAPAPAWWDELYDAPELQPEPTPAPTTSTDRLPRWWEKKTLLGTHSEPEPDEDDEPEDDSDEDDQDQLEEDDTEGAEAGTDSSPARKGKAAKKKSGKKRRPADDRSLRVIAFNGVAAGVGYSVGLVPVFGQWLPVAEQAATGMLGLVLAAGGAVAAWKLTGNEAVHKILPYPPLSRTLISVGAAELGRRLAPAAVEWINQHGAQWGLGASAVSLLLTAGGMCGGLWWLGDRRARAWHWTARLVVRIPLASALLATALYAPGSSS